MRHDSVDPQPNGHSHGEGLPSEPGDRPLRVLHVVSDALPDLSGYTVRTHAIVTTQAASGMVEPTVVVWPRRRGGPARRSRETIDGVVHRRVTHPGELDRASGATERLCATSSRWREALSERSRRGSGSARRAAWALDGVEEVTLARHFRHRLAEVVAEVRPDLLHAHSPYRCALGAIEVGRRFRIPTVYEVRGLWEESAVAEGKFARTSLKYRYWRSKETAAMRRADAVVTICDGLRSEIAARGVPDGRIVAAPNAVDADRFDSDPGRAEPDESVRSIAARLRGTTLGYVGSLRRLEGVDRTVRCAAALLAEGSDISLLVVGDGPELAPLKSLAQSLGLGDRAVFTGRVPHEAVRHHMTLIDVFMVTRPALPVTELVTPLKPLEAMAMRRALIVTDLPALRELVEEGRTGLLARAEDLDDLVRQCRRCVDDTALRATLSEAARAWVVRHRNWGTTAEAIRSAYALALGATVSSEAAPVR